MIQLKRRPWPQLLLPTYLLCVGLLSGQQTESATSKSEDRIAAIKQTKIENGTITFAGSESDLSEAEKAKTPANLPPHTIVKIFLTPASGSEIKVEVWLPAVEKWNGRFVGLGNGGSAGSINPGVFTGPLSAGYAAATTDMGTAHSGINNPEVWKDFGFRSTHLMTVVAKQIIKAYYGKDPEYSYFKGGSTGGQQALQEAQRYPDDYDGIIAGIPAHCRTPLHAYFLWNAQIFNRCPFTKEQQANVIAAGNEYMAARQVPVLAGKVIADPRCTHDDIEAVVALALKKDPTLTPQHADALRKLFEGPRHAITGERIFDGLPFGSSFDIAHGHLYLFQWVFGSQKNLMEIDFGKDIDTYTAALAPYLNAENADLSRFQSRGGKLIMYSGSADSCVPYHATLDYYERVIERFGSLEKVQSFYKFYIVPGLSHGPGPVINNWSDPFNLLVAWREKSVAPEAIHARSAVAGKVEIDIPVYPYPAQATWDEASKTYKPVDGPRGNVDRVAERFRPPAAE